MTGQRLTVTDLGRSIESQTNDKHNIKRADRLLSNCHLQTERLEVTRSLCHQLLSSRTRPVVLIDWSDLDKYKQHFLLRAAITLEGRSLTLYEEVHTIETMEKPLTHRQFLSRFKAILPKDCCPILVTDAGFRTAWFKWVEEMGWDWLGRVRNRHDLRWRTTGPWFDAKKCYQQASSRPKYLGEGVLTRKHEMSCQLTLYKGKPKGRVQKNRFGEPSRSSHSRKNASAQREPWLLATSLSPCSNFAKKMVTIYQKRMQIEEGFRDMKSHRFGLGLNYHRCYSVARLQILLLIALLALMVIWLLGCATILKQQHYQFQANTVRQKPTLSVIFIGMKMIHNTRTKLSTMDIKAAWDKLHQEQLSW